MVTSTIAMCAMFVLMFLGVPLAVNLGLIGFIGFGLLVGFTPSAAMSAQIAWDTLTNYSLATLPMFLLMGNFVNHAGMSKQLYDASNAFVGHRKGGLAKATIIACGGLSAVSGSSVAEAAMMAKIAMPEMRRFGYAEKLSAASIAAGGTLGIIIPPSTTMVIYAQLTETNLGKLLIAGIIPGILGILLYNAAVDYHCWRDPKAGPPGPRTPWRQRFILLKDVWTTVVLFVVSMGGIYVGAFTAEEAAGVGAFGGFVIALTRGLTWESLINVVGETARTTCTLFTVLIGALIFQNLITVSGISGDSVRLLKEGGFSPGMIIFLISVMYVLLGTFLESISMLLLTVPVLFPLVTQLGYDPVWFGVYVVVMIEISIISPPVGGNLFVIQNIAGVPPSVMNRGIIPFITADCVRVAIICFFPWTVMVLPNTMLK